jgi:hypothetical protein
MGKFLSELPEGSKGKYAMVGFSVSNTLSESGTVSRGICENDEKTHYLTSVVERTKIERHNGVVQYLDENETYYLRCRQVLKDPTCYWSFDYLELCPKSVYGSPEGEDTH